MQGILIVAVASLLATGIFESKVAADDQGRSQNLEFVPGTLVISGSVYVGNASTVTPGEDLPPGCAGGANGSSDVSVPTTTPNTSITVSVPCGSASDNGEYPNLFDSHNVWNNNANGNNDFGVTSPIFLEDITTNGIPLRTLPIPSDLVVTSFSSKSELALSRSVDGKSLTFVGYQGGPGCGGFPVSPTAPNLLDVSNSNTPGICDPTNPVISSWEGGFPTAYYRAVIEVDAHGHIQVTDGNAYSGDNGRAVIKGGNGLYYVAGNDNSGNIPKKSILSTPIGIDLVNATGAELLVPGQDPPVPPNVAMIGRLQLGSDKPGKDTNFRGVTIFNNTLYVTKGSGGNGINTIYQVGTPGTLPTGTAAELATVPITIPQGFPSTTDSTNTAFPFGMFFANASTLYVCDEGDGNLVTPAVDGNVATALAQTMAGVQKWVLQDGTWSMVYVLNNGMNIGAPYRVPNYPAALNPATDGCRNLTGRVNRDGTVDIYAVTSTVSTNGDPGADPNKLMKVTDILNAKSLPTGHGFIGRFVTLRSARAREVFRGVAFAPEDHPEF
jgi:hypothetical protein